MDRLRDISDDCDVAEFDQTVLKGFEIKRLLPGARGLCQEPLVCTNSSQRLLTGQWLCDGSINAWFEYLISKYENLLWSYAPDLYLEAAVWIAILKSS